MDARAVLRSATRSAASTLDGMRARDTRRRQLNALATSEHERLITVLREEVRGLDSQRAALEVSPWWRGVRTELVDLIERDDPRRFLTWRPIQDTMFVSPRAAFVDIELATLQADPDWTTRWRPALEESPAGSPPPYRALPSSSANLVHHAFHLLELERTIGRHVETLGQVLEFGGGYGSFARLFRALGFDGEYTIYDFPELSALQRYFLDSVAVAADRGGFSAALTTTSDRTSLPAPIDDSLFVALWSLSETPAGEREPWCAQIASYDYVLIAFQETFEDTDNRKWFGALADRLASHEWQVRDISHLPGNAYLFGSRRR